MICSGYDIDRISQCLRTRVLDPEGHRVLVANLRGSSTDLLVLWYNMGNAGGCYGQTTFQSIALPVARAG